MHRLKALFFLFIFFLNISLASSSDNASKTEHSIKCQTVLGSSNPSASEGGTSITGPSVKGMLHYADKSQQYPSERSVEERILDFKEIYVQNNSKTVAEQSSRCIQCGVPFCQIECPLHNNIPDWLLRKAQGREEEAYELTVYTSDFGEICGRICPKDRLCEGNCVAQQSGHGAITIGSVEVFLTETAFEQGWVKEIHPQRERDESVALIGSGPASLSAAAGLRRFGYEVHIYERMDRPGGLLTFGIPNFKLPKEVVDRRIEWIDRSGRVHWLTSTEVGGSGVSFQSLREKHNAIFIATGVYHSRTLDWQNEAQPPENLVQAFEYLVASNRNSFGIAIPAHLNAEGKNVIVIGGGDTAMDCVRTATRQNAKSVTCVYRRDRSSMPGSMTEVKAAEKEGVTFVFMAMPVGMPEVGIINYVRTQLVGERHRGRGPGLTLGSESKKLNADLVILALGFDPEDLSTSFDEEDLYFTRYGTLLINDFETMKTNLDRVFAGGDIVRGGNLVVRAVRDGRVAALSIHRYLSNLSRSQ